MSLIKKSLLVSAGEGTARLLGVMLFAVLARLVSVEEFGTINFALSVAVVGASAIDLGQNAHASRLVARGVAASAAVVKVTWKAKALTTVVVGVVTAVALSALGYDPVQVQAATVMILWAGALSVFDTQRACLRAESRFVFDASANALESTLRLAIVLAVALLGWGVMGVAGGFVAEAVVAAVLIGAVARMGREHGPSTLPSDELGLGQFMIAAIPSGLLTLSLAAFSRLDQIVLVRVAGSEANGYYSAAARVAFTACVAAQMVVSAAYPEMALQADDRLKLTSIARRSLAIVGTASVCIAAVLAVLARPLLLLLYGSEFGVAAPELRVLSVVVLFNGVSALALYLCLARQLERAALKVILVVGAVSAVAFVAAIEAFGGMGAAAVSAVAEATLAVGLAWIAWSGLRGRGEPA